MNVMMDIDNVSSVALDYETKLAAAMEILHDPTRQPQTVRKNCCITCQCFKKNWWRYCNITTK